MNSIISFSFEAPTFVPKSLPSLKAFQYSDWDFIFSQFRDDLVDVLNENLNSISFPKENQYQLSHT